MFHGFCWGPTREYHQNLHLRIDSFSFIILCFTRTVFFYFPWCIPGCLIGILIIGITCNGLLIHHSYNPLPYPKQPPCVFHCSLKTDLPSQFLLEGTLCGANGPALLIPGEKMMFKNTAVKSHHRWFKKFSSKNSGRIKTQNPWTLKD